MTDFDDQIKDWIDRIDGDYVIAVEAEKFLRSASPTELNDWLHERAETFIAQRMQTLSKASHMTAVRRHGASVFAGAARSFTSGDPGPLMHLDVHYPVEGNVRRPLRDMTAADLEITIDGYDRRAASNAFMAAYLRAIQKRCKGGKRVGEVFSNEQLDAIWKSVGPVSTGGAA